MSPRHGRCPTRRAPARMRGSATFERSVGAAALLLLAASCARKAPPSGGPPDLTPPRIVAAVPDSGAARVALDARLSITFSKGMEPAATGNAVSIAPRLEIRQRRWSGRTLTVVLDSLFKSNQTYTLFIAPSARDRHGNTLPLGKTIVFSTADSFPPGRIEGKIEALGFAVEGTYLWCYHGERAPDSTARDFDALGVADEQGRFRIPGLAVPGRYRLWAFADLNHNRSFEPDHDVLAPADTTIELTPERPVASGLALRVRNPRAPAHVRGIVEDPTGDTLGVLRVIAIASDDTTRRVIADADAKRTFDLQLTAGTWLVRAWRDEDKNRAWRQDVEPASEIREVRLAPAEELNDVKLGLKHWVQPE